MIKNWIALGVVAVLVLVTIIIGFANVKSPGEARSARFDSTRSSNLQKVKAAIERYYEKNGKLPDKLEDLDLAGNEKDVIRDPETDKIYEYNKKGSFDYELCAVFGAEKKSPLDDLSSLYRTSTTSYTDFETHGKGRQCFSLKVSTLLYDDFGDNLPGDSCSYGTEKALGVEFISADKPNNSITYKDADGKEQTKLLCKNFFGYDDKSFKTITLADLKPGDSLDLYFSTDGKIYYLYVKSKSGTAS